MTNSITSGFKDDDLEQDLRDLMGIKTVTEEEIEEERKKEADTIAIEKFRKEDEERDFQELLDIASGKTKTEAINKDATVVMGVRIDSPLYAMVIKNHNIEAKAGDIYSAYEINRRESTPPKDPYEHLEPNSCLEYVQPDTVEVIDAVPQDRFVLDWASRYPVTESTEYFSSGLYVEERVIPQNEVIITLPVNVFVMVEMYFEESSFTVTDGPEAIVSIIQDINKYITHVGSSLRSMHGTTIPEIDMKKLKVFRDVLVDWVEDRLGKDFFNKGNPFNQDEMILELRKDILATIEMRKNSLSPKDRLAAMDNPVANNKTPALGTGYVGTSSTDREEEEIDELLAKINIEF